MENLFERAIKYFYKICEIPHGSGDMKKISQFCVDFADNHGFKCVRDEADNVIIFKSATKGYESYEPIILQGHLDMVCQSVNSFDFLNNGITIKQDGDFLSADGTTLGADNGIAVAMILAILESSELCHPAIEAVFTTDEEIGMIGASKLDLNLLNSKKMINLDSEDDGIVTVSCAGGADFIAKLPVETKPIKGELVKITLAGLKGGHSGVEINKGRVNADVLAGRLLAMIDADYNIVSVNGGNKGNAIPNTCIIELVAENADQFSAMAENVFEEIKTEIYAREEGAKIFTEACPQNEYIAFTDALTKTIVSVLTLVPNGIIEMSAEIEGLVETSLNLGVLQTSQDFITMHFALRSNKKTALFFLIKRLEMFFTDINCETSTGGYYPPWEYNDSSTLQELYCATYRDMYNQEAKVEAIHAGLECAVFSAGIKDLDCISIGPQLYDVHTVSERMSLSSTENLLRLLVKILENCKF